MLQAGTGVTPDSDHTPSFGLTLQERTATSMSAATWLRMERFSRHHARGSRSAQLGTMTSIHQSSPLVTHKASTSMQTWEPRNRYRLTSPPTSSLPMLFSTPDGEEMLPEELLEEPSTAALLYTRSLSSTCKYSRAVLKVMPQIQLHCMHKYHLEFGFMGYAIAAR